MAQNRKFTACIMSFDVMAQLAKVCLQAVAGAGFGRLQQMARWRLPVQNPQSGRFLQDATKRLCYLKLKSRLELNNCWLGFMIYAASSVISTFGL
jgi:hypothetical protein